MTTLKSDEAEVRLAIREVAQQIAGVLRQTDDTGRQARDLEWTIGETAAHILAALREHIEFVEGRMTPWPVEDIPSMNRSRIDEIPERAGSELADLIVESADEFVRAAENRSPGEPFLWFSGQQIDFSPAMAILPGGNL